MMRQVTASCDLAPKIVEAIQPVNCGGEAKQRDDSFGSIRPASVWLQDGAQTQRSLFLWSTICGDMMEVEGEEDDLVGASVGTG